MLDVHLLGRPEVSIDGKPIEVDTRKAIALLAYLVVERSASRDALAGLLWADASQERARATLRRTLSALRSATGTDLISADRNLVTLVGRPISDVDTLLTELDATANHGHDPLDVCHRCIPHLARATETYRGDFLQGFSVKASPEFEDWVRSVSESTRIRVGEAFNRLGTALAAQGQYPAAIAAVRRWIDLDTLHEPAHRFLMLLNAWAGDRPGAIEAYRNCVAILDQELGVSPLDETTELYEAILDEDLPPAPGVRRRVKAEAPPPGPTRSDLIDRETELQILRDEARHVMSGQGRVLVMSGAAWMGKTRLLEEMSTESTLEGHHALVGRAFRMEQPLPYGVATQILRSAMPHIEQRRAEIPGWALAELGRLLPEIGQVADGEDDQFGELRLLEAIHIVIGAIAKEQPVLMVVDDAQWVDTASGSVLSYLARRIAGLPVLLIAAARSGEELSPAMDDVFGYADRHLLLQPLTAQHLAPLVGDDGTARRLVESTGGVPLLIVEALASEEGAARSEEGMARYMEARLREISDLGRQIVTAAAVLSGLCDATMLRETSGRGEEEVVEAVEELVGAGLLREIPESANLSFSLDALERIIYESTSLVRRRLLHRRAANALAERGRSRTDAGLAAAVANHFQAAGEPQASTWYHRAGDLARAMYAHESARSFYESSLALGNTDVAAVHLALGELALDAADYERARQELTVASAHAGTDTIGLVEHRMGELERLLGRFELADEHFARSIENHPSPAIVLADWALLAHRTGQGERSRELAEMSRSVAEQGGDPMRLSRVHNILAVVSQDETAALDHVEEALRLAGDDETLRIAALNNKALLLTDTGEDEAAVGLLEEAIDIAARTGHRHREAALWNHLADLHHRAGREDESRDSLTRSVSLFADIDSGDPEPELWLLSRW